MEDLAKNPAAYGVPTFNQFAANHTDKRVEAKIKRIRRSHGLDPDKRKPRRAIAQRGFNTSLTKGFDGKVRERS